MREGFGLDNGVLKCRAQHDKITVEDVRHGNRQIGVRVVVAPDRRTIESLEEAGLWGAFQAIYRAVELRTCLLYTSPSPRDGATSRMPSSA